MNCQNSGIDNRSTINLCHEHHPGSDEFGTESNSVRPITTLIPIETETRPESPADDSRSISFDSSYTHILEPLEVGDIINAQYEITTILPAFKNLNCYLAKQIGSNAEWCGQCGQKITATGSQFCSRCGYDLADNQLLLLEGDRHAMNGIKKVLLTNITHEGILKFFSHFHFNNRYYSAAQLCEGKTLDAVPEAPNAHTLINWCMVLGGALEILHKHGFYQPDLSLAGIFWRADGPKLVNFSTCKYISNRSATRKKASRMKRKDMKALTKAIQKLITNSEIMNRGWGSKEGLISVLKEILDKAIKNEFKSMSRFVAELDRIKNYTISPPVRKKQNKTPAAKQELLNGTKILIGKGSDRGILRSLNEDSVAIYEYTSIFESVSNPMGLCIVADGMGGHKNGEVASRIAIQTISEKINQALFSEKFAKNGFYNNENELQKIMENAVFDASDEINTIARAKQSDMGATISAVLIIKDKAYIINVGDSRIYHINKAGLQLVSEDHSMVYRLYKIGQIDYDEIYIHPRRNQILRCLGESALSKNLKAMASNANHGYFFIKNLQKGDRLLLCSDGLWEMIRDDRLEQILTNDSHPQNACDELIRVANENGGEDNISVIVIKIE